MSHAEPLFLLLVPYFNNDSKKNMAIIKIHSIYLNKRNFLPFNILSFPVSKVNLLIQ